MRKTKKLVTAIVVIGLLAGATSLMAIDWPQTVPTFWQGTGTGSCTYNNDTIDVFHYWQLEQYPANTNGVKGCWWDDDDHEACVWGIIEEGTGDCEYVLSGYWKMHNPVLPGNGYDGTFEICVDSVNTTTWTASGTWTATHDSLGSCSGNISGSGYFQQPDPWYNCDPCPPPPIGARTIKFQGRFSPPLSFRKYLEHLISSHN